MNSLRYGCTKGLSNAIMMSAVSAVTDFIFLCTGTLMKPLLRNAASVIVEFSLVLSFVLHFRKEELFLVTHEA